MGRPRRPTELCCVRFAAQRLKHLKRLVEQLKFCDVNICYFTAFGKIHRGVITTFVIIIITTASAYMRLIIWTQASTLVAILARLGYITKCGLGG